MATTGKQRAKLNFDLDDTKEKNSKATPVMAITTTEIRKTVATRLPPELYRQAKARAALEGISIQAIIETALTEFIERGKQ
jgi:predicted HicB family RNase H-like nuclease